MSLIINQLSGKERIENLIDVFEKKGKKAALGSIEKMELSKNSKRVIYNTISALSGVLSNEKKEALRKELIPLYLSSKEKVLEDEEGVLPKIFQECGGRELTNVACVNHCFSRVALPILHARAHLILDARTRLSESNLFPYIFQHLPLSMTPTLSLVNYHVNATKAYMYYEQLQKKTRITLNEIAFFKKALKKCGKDVESLFRNLSNLKTLDVGKSSGGKILVLFQEVIPHLKKCIQLRELDCKEFIGGDYSKRESSAAFLVEAIKSSPSITSLNLADCFSLQGSDCKKIIAEGSSLKQLNLKNCRDPSLQDSSLEELALKCSNLIVLNLGGDLHITDASLSYVPSTLQILSLNRSGSITDNGLDILSTRCRELVTLKINKNTAFTGNGLQSLTKLSHLRRLDIKGCTRLTMVDLSACLEKMSSLSQLTLNCRNLEESDFNALVPSLKNITSLSLFFVEISEEKLLDFLRHCPKIETLKLRNCTVSQERLNQLLAQEKNFPLKVI